MIPKTNLHASRVVEQLQRNLINLQRDIRNNAMTHRQMAMAQTPNLQTLQAFIADCITQYEKHLGWVDTFFADQSKMALVSDHISHATDIEPVVSALRTEVIALKNTRRNTYQQIIVACDATLARVDAPESLWPE